MCVCFIAGQSLCTCTKPPLKSNSAHSPPNPSLLLINLKLESLLYGVICPHDSTTEQPRVFHWPSPQRSWWPEMPRFPPVSASLILDYRDRLWCPRFFVCVFCFHTNYISIILIFSLVNNILDEWIVKKLPPLLYNVIIFKAVYMSKNILCVKNFIFNCYTEYDPYCTLSF